MRTKKLMRTTYKTDATDDEPEYIGAFSDPFPDPGDRGALIVNVDWGVRGEVEVTYMVPA